MKPHRIAIAILLALAALVTIEALRASGRLAPMEQTR